MILRFFSFVVLVWLFGFVWFSAALPKPVGPLPTDAVVVLTGGEGRIDRGLDVLAEKWSPKLLVSGVDKDVKSREFKAEFKISRRLMRCCITLDYESVDTRSNALETSLWLASQKAESVRLITSDWHMRRAVLELERAKPSGVVVLADAVPTTPSFRILVLEYHKLIARQLSWMLED